MDPLFPLVKTFLSIFGDINIHFHCIEASLHCLLWHYSHDMIRLDNIRTSICFRSANVYLDFVVCFHLSCLVLVTISSSTQCLRSRTIGVVSNPFLLLLCVVLWAAFSCCKCYSSANRDFFRTLDGRHVVRRSRLLS